MDALELALRCSSLLLRAAAKGDQALEEEEEDPAIANQADQLTSSYNQTDELNDSDREDHFKGQLAGSWQVGCKMF